MSEEPGRITRRFLTPPVHDVHAHLRLSMEALGMDVRVDAAGNLRGLWTPASTGQRRLIIGSHIDTVPDAGAFDGVLGVTMALEWVSLAQEIAFPIPIEVIAFSEEEGVRFGVPFIGSRAVAGRFDPSLLALKDGDGISRRRSHPRIRSRSGEDTEDAAVHHDGAAFVEIHIEQGPVLETEHRSVGVVTGIVGQTRLSLEFTGQANHAGTTPMHLRRDALAAAAEWIVFVEAFARHRWSRGHGGQSRHRAKCANVIPGKARVSLDVRHALDSQRMPPSEELIAKARAIAERRSLALTALL